MSESTPAVFENADALRAAIGKTLGPSAWLKVEQDRINLFADATDDHQWIHVDVERARQGPFGAPIAHGYLTLALVNHFLPQLVSVPTARRCSTIAGFAAKTGCPAHSATASVKRPRVSTGASTSRPYFWPVW